MIQIIQKFYDWENGSILINNSLSLRDLNTTQWRNKIGIVPQEITLFQGTVLDNILLGDEFEEMKFVSFIQAYNFERFITNLPQGIATIIGEEGVNLSGGQKQLLGLMRALYKNPEILILDEPTASMDENNIILLTNLISKSAKTFIIVAHLKQDLQIKYDKVVDLNQFIG